MEMPPPYTPKKKTNTGLIIGLIIGGVLLCCIAPIGLLAGGAWFGFKQVGPIATCGMAVEDLQNAVKDYAAENNGVLPKAASWQDDVKPFYAKIAARNKKDNPFGSMPAEGEWGCESDGTKTGFAFNAELSAKKLAEVKDKTVPVIFETPERKMNLSMAYKPQDASKSPKIFGERRGWFVAPLEGTVDMVGASGQRAEFNTRRNR